MAKELRTTSSDRAAEEALGRQNELGRRESGSWAVALQSTGRFQLDATTTAEPRELRVNMLCLGLGG